MLNELILQLITYHLMTSYFSTNLRFDSIIGWSLIGFTSFLIGVNLLFILWQTIKAVWQKLMIRKNHKDFIKLQAMLFEKIQTEREENRRQEAR